MYQLDRQGVNLRFEDVGKGAPHIVLIHDLGYDHTSFTPQIRHFRRKHRVVAVDLRGHGLSDSVAQEYGVADFANDVAWLCYELGVYRPVIVGHGLGGLVALELAARHPDLPTALVALNSPVLPPAETQACLRAIADLLLTQSGHETLRRSMGWLLPPNAKPSFVGRVLESVSSMPWETATSIWRDFLVWDAHPAVTACRVPMLYIDAGTEAANLAMLESLCPNLIVAGTVDTGHFHQLEAPEQINTMIECFMAGLPTPIPL